MGESIDNNLDAADGIGSSVSCKADCQHKLLCSVSVVSCLPPMWDHNLLTYRQATEEPQWRARPGDDASAESYVGFQLLVQTLALAQRACQEMRTPCR